MKLVHFSFLLSAFFVYTTIESGSVFGHIFHKKNSFKTDTVKTESNKINDNLPKITLLGKEYRIDNVDIPAATIYENHTRDELISLLTKTIDLSSFRKEQDSITESYKKYFAATIASAKLLEGFAAAVHTVSSRIIENEQPGGFIGHFRRSEAYRANEISQDELFGHLPSHLLQFTDGRFSAFVDTYSTETVRYFTEQHLGISDVDTAIMEVENFILSLLIKDTYLYWHSLNKWVFKKFPSTNPQNYVFRWESINAEYLNVLDPNIIALWKPILWELQKHSKHLEK